MIPQTSLCEMGFLLGLLRLLPPLPAQEASPDKWSPFGGLPSAVSDGVPFCLPCLALPGLGLPSLGLPRLRLPRTEVWGPLANVIFNLGFT